MYITWLNEQPPTPFYGTKAQLLNTLAINNVLVPRGFIITNEAFNEFLTTNTIDITFLDNLNLEDPEQVMHAAEQLTQAILQGTLPETLQQALLEAYEHMTIDTDIYKNISKEALHILKTGRETPRIVIRPSCTEGHEGITYFNIKGKEQLQEHIKKAWASLFQAETLHQHFTGAELIIQKMITIERAGIIWKEEYLTIEAALGYGDVVTKKLVTPDVYTIDDQGTIIQKQVNKQEFMLSRDAYQGNLVKKPLFYNGNGQKLSDYDIKHVAKLYQRAQELLNKNLIIEFAFDSNQLYLIQAQEKIEKPNIVEQAIKNGNHQEHHDTTEETTTVKEPITLREEDLQTITEIKTYLTQANTYQRCDGVYSTALLEELATISTTYTHEHVWQVIQTPEQLTTIATLQDQGHTNIGLALTNITEIERLKDIKKQLKKLGIEPLEEIEVGLVVTAPATLYLLDDIDREGIDFLIVDFNNLGENTLGSTTADKKNKGYLKLLHTLVKECKLRNIEIGIAGTFDDELIDFFVKAGFDSLIVPPEHLETTKKKVARAEKRLLLNVARKDIKEF
ncbi:MAG: PEP/pyruvate-binding domain-containing protein [Nanoarchaeota archaeon]|nr:PEP/pyruvate-binding domain-containing protein [Nanoarchaeota archaeon]